jgi:hypothetical protein
LMDSFWSGGEDIGQYGAPRMFGASVRYHF